MPAQTLYTWKQAPFLRLVIPFIAGIAAAGDLHLPVAAGWLIFWTALSAFLFFNLFASSFLRFRSGWWNGAFISLVFFAAGAIIQWHKTTANQPNRVDNYYQPGDVLMATIDEPPTEKPNSFKTSATLQWLSGHRNELPVKGRIIIYFEKDSTFAKLSYGSRILFSKPLQPIGYSGNPGAFNYSRYAAMQGIYHQVYLSARDCRVLPGKNENLLKKWLIASRSRIVNTIGRYIPGKKEAGLAEALLVGYKINLDKELEQSYANTGVVHIIAISGLHLGLIYAILLLLLKALPNNRATKWLQPLLIISGLWLFTFLAGGGPSIARAAVMFSFVVLGNAISRRVSVYNTLAASAFVLLLINPFWLWDAGFQLSYIAVLSIVIFMQPIYNWFSFQNKIIDSLWKLSAITLAAQVLTTPLSIYLFHQFPNYFLLTNLVAVPLSSIILVGELILCPLAFIPPAAAFTGRILEWLIRLMNDFIGYMERLPLSVWNGLQISLAQLALLYLVIAAVTCWLLSKRKDMLLAALAALLGFTALRSRSFLEAERQRELVVYQVARSSAADFISGRRHYFFGDQALRVNNTAASFHLKPGRTLKRLQDADSLPNLATFEGGFYFNNRKIILIGPLYRYHPLTEKIKADLVIVSGSPRVSLYELADLIDTPQFVLDASNPARQTRQWMTEAATLGLNCHPVVDNGAFVMRLN